MRKIKNIEIFWGLVLMVLSLVLSVFCAYRVSLPLEWAWTSWPFLLLLLILFFGFELLWMRLHLAFFPLPIGPIEKDSKEEFHYHIYLSHNLMFFYPLMMFASLPTPLRKVIFKALGAKMGVNSYSSGMIFDPSLVEIGDHSVCGYNSVLIPHQIEGDDLAHDRIVIGNHVTIGAHAIVMSGCRLEDGSALAAGAVLPKKTVIPAGEVWGGVPAKPIKSGT